MKRPNKIKFELIDNTNIDNYNESCKMEKIWYGNMRTGQTLDLETYYYFCKEFAAALGFSEKTINEWFGDNGI